MQRSACTESCCAMHVGSVSPQSSRKQSMFESVQISLLAGSRCTCSVSWQCNIMVLTNVYACCRAWFGAYAGWLHVPCMSAMPHLSLDQKQCMVAECIERVQAGSQGACYLLTHQLQAHSAWPCNSTTLKLQKQLQNEVVRGDAKVMP